MPWIIGGAVLGSALAGSHASRRAASASESGSRAAIEEQRRQFDEIKKLNQPVIDARNDALSALRDLVGLPAAAVPAAMAPAETAITRSKESNAPRPLHRGSSYRGYGGGGYRMMAKGGTFAPGEKIIAGENGAELVNQGGQSVIVSQPTAFKAQAPGSVVPIKSNYQTPINTGKPPTSAITLANNNPATYELDPETGEYRIVENDGGKEGGYQFQTDPGYNFRLAEGRRALDMGASAAGRALSGAAIKAALRYNQDYATNEFSNIYNRLAGIAHAGQVAANTVGEAGYGTGQNIAGSLQTGANARASGYLGQGNAIQNAMNQGLYIYGMNNQPKPVSA